MDFKIIYEDENVLVVDKPAGIVVFPPAFAQGFGEAREGKTTEKTLIDYIIEKYPDLKSVGEAPRYGIVHRLDKDTSGVLLVAKTTEALIFFQKQFKTRGVEKKYIALATGVIKEDSGTIETLMARSSENFKKQTNYPLDKESPSRRLAVTEFKVLSRLQSNRGSSTESGQRFEKYTLLEVMPKTGRKHQIRSHLAYIHHPVAGDTLYGFKDSPTPENLKRQFLHAMYLKIQLPGGEMKEFKSDLPQELQEVLKYLPS